MPVPWRVHEGGAGDTSRVPKARLYLSGDVVRDIEARSSEQARRRREDLGLLVGDWALDGDGDVYAVAIDLRTGPLVSSPSSVRFSPEGLSRVARDLDATPYTYVIVGWYHTHLGLGAFMSDRDLRTQRGGFPHPHQVALVVDPLEGEAAAFANGPGGPGTLPVAVASFDEWDMPLAGDRPRQEVTGR